MQSPIGAHKDLTGRRNLKNTVEDEYGNVFLRLDTKKELFVIEDRALLLSALDAMEALSEILRKWIKINNLPLNTAKAGAEKRSDDGRIDLIVSDGTSV